MTAYTGSCHCSAISCSYSTALPPSNWSVRACKCSFCRLHDVLSTSDPNGSLAFEAAGPGVLQRYRFGLKTADFLLCRNCGVYVGAMIDTNDGAFGIVNIRTLRNPPDNMADVQPISYANEVAVDRVLRRQSRWTPIA